MYDWIVIGAGIAGTLLSYELLERGFSVLLIDDKIKRKTSLNDTYNNATDLSYGGLAFWSGTNQLTSQLCQESINYYQNLSARLGAEIEYRQLDLLLTIPPHLNPREIANNYSKFVTIPRSLTIEEACTLEPLLNPDAISGALTVKHGHIHPQKMTQALLQRFLEQGGNLETTTATQVDFQQVTTSNGNYNAANIAIAAGGMTRNLLTRSRLAQLPLGASHFPLQVYFTHAEIIETPPIKDIQLQTLVMPANLQRFSLEAQSTRNDAIWQQPGREIIPPILDPGAVQFTDGSLRIGQISRTLTDVNADIDINHSEQSLRQSIAKILPPLANLPGTCKRCLVAFSKDNLPVVGTIPQQPGIYVFSGFSNPLVFIPPLAKRFSHWVSTHQDEIIPQLSPTRFIKPAGEKSGFSD